ncbi:acyl-CoA dehydrogenase/oxidase [Cristinia sonorae]|uniref:Acyl-CoA dehydrogenase/oxidase n=1 Tax=Cristinia sonorae TaxID=1940300 RepID=A0A8K0UU90_9AGAR|nr:acyl-CoA dehydrogenase/oxidase [Cristinia sonorae]
MRVEEGFQPTPYVEGNPYVTDTVLPSLLARLVPLQARSEIESDLGRFGDVVLTTLRSLSAKATEPKLVQYDQWGKRIDDLQTSEGWRGLKAVIQQEGVPGIFYERKHGEFSRVHGFMKVLLATADSQVIFCPLSMTDGAARVIELIGSEYLKRDVYSRLTSRDFSIAFTAGQWMTERSGGSDVSQTETVATPQPNLTSPYGPVYSLNGFKWFSSATDSDISVALARTGSISAGSRGLSLFLIPLRKPLLRSPTEPLPSSLTNGIRIHRLKNKIGTKVLPTAELSLDDTEAYLLGPLNQGVKMITPILNITRMHSAISSIGYIRKCLSIATAYARVRTISGGKELLSSNSLHTSVLAKAGLTYRALTHMTFGAVLLLGKVECGVASEEEELRLRLLTSAAKAFAAHHGSAVIEECMAAMGGQGYMEENGFGTALKDAIVEKIWEGTITVLSLDLVRATSKPEVMPAFLKWANNILSSIPSSFSGTLATAIDTLHTGLTLLTNAYIPRIPPIRTSLSLLTGAPSSSPTENPLLPRPALFLFSNIASSIYLLEHAIWAMATKQPSAETDIEVFRRWVEEGGLKESVEDVRRVLEDSNRNRTEMDRQIVYGEGRNSASARL